MSLEDILLNEISQSQKEKHCRVPPTCQIQRESRMGAGGRERYGLTETVLVWKDERKVWRWMVVMATQQWECPQCH